MTTSQLTQLRAKAEAYGHRGTLAPRTRESYRYGWKAFTDWAWPGDDNWPLPADPALVATFLMHRAESGSKMGTIARDFAAIGYVHKHGGLANPCDDRLVKNVMARLRRDLAEVGKVEPKQAIGLTAEHFARIRSTALKPRPRGGYNAMESEKTARRRGLMEIATISVMSAGLLRRSEAAALRWRDLKVAPDGSGVVTIMKSKTSSNARRVPILPVTTLDLKAVKPQHAAPHDRILRAKRGRTLALRIRNAGKHAGLGDGFTGHSPRVGMAQDLTSAGASTAEIAIAGRWKNTAMVVRYSSHVASERSAVMKYLG